MCREIKQNIVTGHIPVLLLTALGAAEHQMTGIDCGADDYIVKPFNLTLLAGKVRNILKARLRFREQIRTQLNDSQADEITYDPFIRSVISVLCENIDNSGFGVEELGLKMNMSRSTFYRKIKSLAGMSPVEFVRMVRIREGGKLLRDQQLLSVNEIALKVGFEDVDYFRDCFKKHFGLTPTDFQKQK